MKYAAIDIGTNTVLLLIVEKEEHLRDIIDLSTIVKLGEGLTNSGCLGRAAMSRTMDTLKRYADITSSHNVKKLFCVGTAALREAQNSEEFASAVKDAFGFNVEIISPEREAYYTYISVRDDPRVCSDDMAIVDIGGGSTEVIDGSRKVFTGYDSLPMGSVKLTDMFITRDPPVREELERAVSHIKKTLSRIVCREGSVLVGTGGTLTNIASIMIGLQEYDKERIHGFSLEFPQLERLTAELAALSSAGRKALIGMEKGREDIILQGTLILKEIMLHGGFQKCVVSAKGVRYGVIYEKCRE